MFAVAQSERQLSMRQRVSGSVPELSIMSFGVPQQDTQPRVDRCVNNFKLLCIKAYAKCKL